MAHTLTLAEAADMLKTTTETVSDCIRYRGLPAAKIGRAFVLVDDDVIAWLRGQYGHASKPPPHCADPVLAGRAEDSSARLDAALAKRTGRRRR